MIERIKTIASTILCLVLLVVLGMHCCGSSKLLSSSTTGRGNDLGVSAWQPRIPTSFSTKTRIKLSSNFDDKHGPNMKVSMSSESASNSTMAKMSPVDEIYNNQDLLTLKAQATKLREEAQSLQLTLQREKHDKIRRETEKVDRWIEELLIEARVNENTELLKTVDQVFQRLTEDRYSAEQVNKIFKRLCEIRTQESRSNCSPLMSLLVDAAGKLDCTERKDNPNKRWNHKVERILQKKLFARDWNIDLDEEDDDSGNPWKVR
jgi:flagellin-specific chaperone FliS